jgi:hypothetical protein
MHLMWCHKRPHKCSRHFPQAKTPPNGIPPCAPSCVRRAELTRRRVDAVLELAPPAEQLPALSSVVSMTEPAFAACMAKVLSGDVRPRTRTPKCPEAIIRVRYPGLWGQL